MSDNRHYILAHDTARKLAAAQCMLAPLGYHVRITEPTRNLEQNAKMWASLTDIANQVEWYGKKLTPEDWKHVFSSSLRKLEVVPNLDGTGFVALGLSTSKMSIREMSDMIELITSFGIEHKVIFHDGVGE
jgi:hypothetical protein